MAADQARTGRHWRHVLRMLQLHAGSQRNVSEVRYVRRDQWM